MVPHHQSARKRKEGRKEGKKEGWMEGRKDEWIILFAFFFVEFTLFKNENFQKKQFVVK
jgi:hypothetical protein